MKCFLFPKQSPTEDSNAYSFVLKDQNNNKIYVPFINSINKQKYSNLDTNSSLSKKDLQAIFNELSKSKKAISKRNNDGIKSLENYFTQQYSQLQLMKENKQGNSNSCVLIPTVKECLANHEFIIKSHSDVNDMFDEENEVKSILLDNRKITNLFSTKEFSTEFRKFRKKIGMSQADVGQSMGIYLNVDCSQTTVCRLESMSLSLSNLLELIPSFRKWVAHIHEVGKERALHDLHVSKAAQTGQCNSVTDSVESFSPESKSGVSKRKRRAPRVEFTKTQLDRLEQLFQTVKCNPVSMPVYDKISAEIGASSQKIRTWMSKRRSQHRYSLVAGSRR